MSPSGDPGPPPVGRSNVGGNNDTRMTVPMENYQTIVDTLKANNGAEAKAIKAMFGGDKQLMDRFLAMAFSALAADSKILFDADPMSLVQVIKEAASVGLDPMSQDAAIVVYGHTAKLMIQWRGYVKRIRNSREVQDLDCQIVYENDHFALTLGTNPEVIHVPEQAERGGYRGAYAWALMPSGKYIIEWMTEADINYVRDTWGNKRSQSGKPLPWETSWGEMARKTVIRRLAKRLPAAAVDKLLQIEQSHDEAVAANKIMAQKIDDELSEVRQIALRAVGQLPAGEPEQTNREDQGGDDGGAAAAVTADEKPDSGGPGATAEPEQEHDLAPVGAAADTNVAAAMALAEQEEQLRRQRARLDRK